MQTPVDTVIARYTSAAQCAAALGISRQALHQAQARRRLSERAAIRAAALLDIDAGAALLHNAQPENITPPISRPAANRRPAPPRKASPRQAPIDTPAAQPLYYVKSGTVATIKDTAQRCGEPAAMKKNTCKNFATVHSITSKEKSDAIDLIRWVLSVAKMPADSPRFAWYVSRWLIPEKIAHAKEAGTFNASVQNCGPIDPNWIKLVPAALDEYRDFVRQNFRAKPNCAPASNTQPHVAPEVISMTA